MSSIPVSLNVSVLTSSKKWILSVIAGVLFALISAPFTYSLTNKLFEVIHLQTVEYEESNVTLVGFILHTIVFALLFRLLLVFYPAKQQVYIELPVGPGPVIPK